MARAGRQPLRALVETYLSEAHLGGCEGGCPVSSLVSEMPRQSPQLRESGAGRVRGLMNLVRRFLPADARPGAATAVTSTLVGALQLARALGDNAEGRAVLAEARQALLSRYEPEGERAPH